MATVAQSYMLRDHRADAVAWADRTIALADRLDLPGLRLAGQVEKGSALINMANGVDAGRKLLVDVADGAEESGEWLIAARALNNLISNVSPSSLTDATQLVERMRRDAERAGFESLAVAAYFQSRAALAMEQGDLDGAVAALDEGLRRDRRHLRTSRDASYQDAGQCFALQGGVKARAGWAARARAVP
jgi:hypothetical protein